MSAEFTYLKKDNLILVQIDINKQFREASLISKDQNKVKIPNSEKITTHLILPYAAQTDCMRKRLFQEIVEINKTTIHTEVFCKQSGSFQIVHTKKKLFLKI